VTIANSFSDLSPAPLADDDLKDFQPKVTPRPAVEPNAIVLEKLSEEQGFTLNNFPPPKRKTLKAGRVASKDRPEPMSLRLRVGDWNRFSTFCERQGLTVADGFTYMLNKLEI
jgi:hypothetical protein